MNDEPVNHSAPQAQNKGGDFDLQEDLAILKKMSSSSQSMALGHQVSRQRSILDDLGMGAFIPPPEELFNASLESHLSGVPAHDEMEKTSTRKNTDLTEKS